MGNCNGRRCDSQRQSKSYQHIIDTHTLVWEIPRSILISHVKNNNVSKKALAKPPLVCNYLVLQCENGNVTDAEMNKIDGVYKKYTTDKSLQWHLNLRNLPNPATITLSDGHYEQLL